MNTLPIKSADNVTTPPRKRRLVTLAIIAAILVLCVALFSRAISTHLRSMSVLARFSSPDSKGLNTRFARHPFTEQLVTETTAVGSIRYRLYIPRDVQSPPGMVLLHGVHHLGIEEPRLVNFSRALAGSGIEVMTPELGDLANYHVVPYSIDVIGTSAGILARTLHASQVGIMGLSFAGGMALLSARRPEYAGNIGFVVAIGAHDDMARVARFFATNVIQKPDGSSVPFQAHEYGVLVLAYSHLEDFFTPADIPVARDALRLWLWEKSDEASASAKKLSPAGQTEFDQLVHHRDQLQQQLLTEIEKHHAEMDAVSPHGHLGSLSVPVFLLHGTGDSVIPASETEWLERDVPGKEIQAALISPALIHVSMESTTTLTQKWQLVDFLAKVLDSAGNLHR